MIGLRGIYRARKFLNRLSGTGPIFERVALVVAHPDDETIAAASQLVRFTRLTLIHVTFGGGAASDLGRAALSRLRRSELAAALAAAQCRPQHKIGYDFVDGDVHLRLPELVARLRQDLSTAELVITHPYEGGHIDHDAVACAVQYACVQLEQATGRSPDRIEAASYHSRRGGVRAGEFWPDPAVPAIEISLDMPAARRRSAAFDCHGSQKGNLALFSRTHEAYRPASTYDFHRLPPPQTVLYGLPMQQRLAAAMAAIA